MPITTSYTESNKVYLGLKDYLLKNCQYKPKVKTMPNNVEFPQVTFELVDDRPLKRTNARMENRSRVTFEVNIFAKDLKGVSKVTVAREIERYVRYYLGDMCGFMRLYSKPTPNIDSQVYRITLRYITPYNEFRGAFINY